jgi:hypothetical protein
MPKLISGSITTPTVSISTPPPYTVAGTRPLAMMQATVSDAVGPHVAGVDQVRATFCLPPIQNFQCADGFILYGQSGDPAKSATKLNLSNQLSSSVTGGTVQTGVYSLYSVAVQDTYGNVVNYQDTAFGGSANLGAMFGTKTINITP